MSRMVYIVWTDNCEEWEDYHKMIHGVYATRELAEKAIADAGYGEFPEESYWKNGLGRWYKRWYDDELDEEYGLVQESTAWVDPWRLIGGMDSAF